MSAATPRPRARRRYLDPIDRVSEVLFGLVMLLTFTGSLSVAEAGRDDVRAMLVGALGCNLAWGIIDGILFLMGSLAEKGRGLAALRAAREASDPEEGRRAIAEAIPEALRGALEPAEIDAIRARLRARPEPAAHARLDRDDWIGAAAVFAWVFLATFPVVVPFLFVPRAPLALRLSNGVAIALLFAAGIAFGRITGRPPWLVGAAMVLLGGALVGLTMALGG